MGRRKTTRGPEEIEYRLMQIIKRTDPIDPRALRARVLAIGALAYMWKVDLGPAFGSYINELEGKVVKGKPIEFASPETKMPKPEDGPTSEEIKPLTTPDPGGIFDGLEEDDE